MDAGGTFEEAQGSEVSAETSEGGEAEIFGAGWRGFYTWLGREGLVARPGGAEVSELPSRWPSGWDQMPQGAWGTCYRDDQGRPPGF